MNLTGLKYFHDVCRTGSVRKTSEKLGISASTVSRHILVLERELGTALLKRSSNGVAVTAAGLSVEAYARMVVLDYETLRTDLDDLKGGGRTCIRIAAVESLVSQLPMQVIEEFAQRHPRTSFNLVSLNAPAVAQAVRTGVCDLGLIYGLPPAPELKVVTEVEHPLVLAVPPGHPLAGEPIVSVARLQGQPLAVHECDHGLRKILDHACRLHGFNLEPVLTSNSLEVLREFVRRGLGAAVLTAGGVQDDIEQGKIVAVPMDEPLFNGNLSLIVLKGRRLSRVLSLFVEMTAEGLRTGRVATPAPGCGARPAQALR